MSIGFDLIDGVATVTIDRPERLNALDPEHYRLLGDAWQRVRDDADVRVAIVTGAGDKAFCVGADITTPAFFGVGAERFWNTQEERLLNRGLEVWKPVVAAVNGFCLGGGMTLLLATDIRVAAEHATFGLPEVSRGVLPGNGGTQRLLEQLPYPIAMDLLLGAQTMDAHTAARWGLVNEVVPEASVVETARRYARRIADNAPLAVQAAKEMATRSRDVDRGTGLRMEQAMNRVLQMTDDVREGAQAFREKRPARFQGR